MYKKFAGKNVNEIFKFLLKNCSSILETKYVKCGSFNYFCEYKDLINLDFNHYYNYKDNDTDNYLFLKNTIIHMARLLKDIGYRYFIIDINQQITICVQLNFGNLPEFDYSEKSIKTYINY